MTKLNPYPELRMLTFADSRMRAALQRIAGQAAEFNLFDRIVTYSEDSLEPDFRARWAEKLQPGIRGYGYMCWKSHLVRRELASMPEDGVLFYCDAGCHLNPQGKERFLGYLMQLEKSPAGVLAFDVPDQLEYRWTKGDVLDFFHCRNIRGITHSPQIASGHLFFRNCPHARDFVEAWNSSWQSDFSLIDETPSRSPNLPGFVACRHDQSLFSILYKRAGLSALSGDQTYAEDWDTLADCPILDMRDRGNHGRDLRRLRRWRFFARFAFGPLRRKYESRFNDLLRRSPFLRKEL